MKEIKNEGDQVWAVNTAESRTFGKSSQPISSLAGPRHPTDQKLVSLQVLEESWRKVIFWSCRDAPAHCLALYLWRKKKERTALISRWAELGPSLGGLWGPPDQNMGGWTHRAPLRRLLFFLFGLSPEMVSFKSQFHNLPSCLPDVEHFPGKMR